MPTVRTNGISTYYEEYGAGPPVVFLHGATSDHRLWAERARPLADDYRVVVYDLRGHGRTGGSGTAPYSVELYADDLAALVAALDLDHPVICGLSMGGMAAQAYAAEHPDAIAGLCTLGAVTPELLTRGEWFERRMLLPALDAASTVVGRDRVGAVMRRLNEWRHEEGASGDLEEAARVQRAHAEEYPEITEAEAEKVRDALTSYPSVDVDHASITVPALLMHAERESETVARHARYMAGVIPDAEAREIPDAGHNAHVDNPEFVVASLREFLGTVS